MGLLLSTQDVARFTGLQVALLAPLDYPTVDAWCTTVLRRAEELFGADRSAMFVPIGNQIHYVSESIDPGSLRAFQEGIREQQPGALRFTEDLVDQAWNARRAQGIEVWSIPTLERLLGRRMDEIQMYHEAVKPAGLTESAVATTQVPAGEAFLGVSHSRPAEATFAEPERLELMTMLVPALKAGVHSIVRLETERTTLAQALDTMGEAVLVCDMAGRELHQSRGLQDLLAAEPEQPRVLGEMRSAACAVSQAGVSGTQPPPRSVGTAEVATRCTRYVVRASAVGPGMFGRDSAILVLLERLTPALPSVAYLVEHHGLTRREAEIALLLAEGFSNREIAARLALSPHTVRHHAEWVFAKLAVHSRKALGLELLADPR